MLWRICAGCPSSLTYHVLSLLRRGVTIAREASRHSDSAHSLIIFIDECGAEVINAFQARAYVGFRRLRHEGTFFLCSRSAWPHGPYSLETV
ncbi:hypothetical protein A0H81_14259 [Grifola frondosa]|uniref:Uncharacterized protein n=1 Tax=Grifola frondosa TaxID=5627 RepID=A0A1C7LLV6_GRIFR|nr:hypothetical protein A0H81_14259 [Grifola frondosa]